jgi:hypothetical protein
MFTVFYETRKYTVWQNAQCFLMLNLLVRIVMTDVQGLNVDVIEMLFIRERIKCVSVRGLLR